MDVTSHTTLKGTTHSNPLHSLHQSANAMPTHIIIIITPVVRYMHIHFAWVQVRRRSCTPVWPPTCDCAVSQSDVKGFASKHIPSPSLPCELFDSSPALVHVTSSTRMPLADDRIGATPFVSDKGAPDLSFRESHLHPSRRAP